MIVPRRPGSFSPFPPVSLAPAGIHPVELVSAWQIDCIAFQRWRVSPGRLATGWCFARPSSCPRSRRSDMPPARSRHLSCLREPMPPQQQVPSRHRGRLHRRRRAVLSNKVLQLSIADGRPLRELPLALAAEHRYVGQTKAPRARSCLKAVIVVPRGPIVCVSFSTCSS